MYEFYLNKQEYENIQSPVIDIISFYDADNYFPCAAPQDYPKEFVRYFVSGTEHEYTLERDWCVRTINMEFDCYSDDYNGAIALGWQIKAIDGQSGVILNNTELLETTIQNEYDLIDIETDNSGKPLFRRVVEMQFKIRDRSVAPKSSEGDFENLESGIYSYLTSHLNQTLEPGKYDQDNEAPEKFLFYKSAAQYLYQLNTPQNWEEAEYTFKSVSDDYSIAWAISEKLRTLLSDKRDNYGNQINKMTVLVNMNDTDYEDGKYQVESVYKIYTAKDGVEMMSGDESAKPRKFVRINSRRKHK